jgi:hypothetical protein
MTATRGKVVELKRSAGIAALFAVTVTATHEDDPEETTITFIGSVYGGPVVMQLPSGAQTFVTAPERFGKFGEEWVCRFVEGIEQ